MVYITPSASGLYLETVKNFSRSMPLGLLAPRVLPVTELTS